MASTKKNLLSRPRKKPIILSLYGLLAKSAIASGDTVPLIYASCVSSTITDGYSVQLRPDLWLHWIVSVERDELRTVLEYDGEAWIGLGLSKFGKMVGSTAIVGLPDQNEVTYNHVEHQKDVSGLRRESANVLHNLSLIQSDGETALSFTWKLLPTSSIREGGPVTFIYAVGANNELGYHRHRGAFTIDLQNCDEQLPKLQIPSIDKEHKLAFALHGFFASLALGIAVPVAVASAWLRKLIPRQWMYLHVSGQMIAFIFLFISLASVVSGIVLKKSSHFRHGHHWTGIFLLSIFAFQGINGFRRPPLHQVAKMTDNLHAIHGNLDGADDVVNVAAWWLVTLPRTNREKWLLMHRALAVFVISLGIIQLRSGILLYSREYENAAIDLLIVFRGYCIFLVFVAVSLYATQYVNLQKNTIGYDGRIASAWRRDQFPQTTANCRFDTKDECLDGEQSLMETSVMRINLI